MHCLCIQHSIVYPPHFIHHSKSMVSQITAFWQCHTTAQYSHSKYYYDTKWQTICLLDWPDSVQNPKLSNSYQLYLQNLAQNISYLT